MTSYRNLLILILSTLFLTPAVAQSGVLTNGNSNLPACAQSCQPLVEAAQTCSGTTIVDQAVWNCFCQYVYQRDFSSSSTVCASVCSASDDQQVTTWFNSNCGSDNGASEHPDTTPTTSGTPAAPTTTAATTGGGTGSSSGSGNQTWWSTHWQWIVMVIVLALGLAGLALLLRFLRNRHRRKQDQINGGFNAGITTRAAPSAPTTNPGATAHVNDSFASGAPSLVHDQSPTESSVRTREAFMPFGYGYTRSESRLGYQADRGSSLPAQRGSPRLGDIEKQDGVVAEGRVQSPDPTNGRSKPGRRIVRRERSSRNYGSNVYSEKSP